MAAAKAADQVVLALGETREMSGEAEARSDLDLPGRQQELIDAIKATGKPFAVVLFNGRPLDADQRRDMPRRRSSRPGSAASRPATRSPTCCSARSTPAASCRCPSRATSARCRSTTTTSRPAVPATRRSKYNSRYRDIPSCAPLYEFGYGLSYTTFKVDNLRLSSHVDVAAAAAITATVDVTNTGSRAGDDVVQLYIHDPVASISQPVRRLRGFQRVTLDAGQKTTVTWTLDASDVGFYDNGGRFRGRAGRDRRLRGRQLERVRQRLVVPRGRSRRHAPPASLTAR